MSLERLEQNNNDNNLIQNVPGPLRQSINEWFSVSDFSKDLQSQIKIHTHNENKARNKVLDNLTNSAVLGRIFSSPENIARLKDQTGNTVEGRFNADFSDFLIASFELMNKPEIPTRELNNLLQRYCTKGSEPINLFSNDADKITDILNTGSRAEKINALDFAISKMMENTGSRYIAFLRKVVCN